MHVEGKELSFYEYPKRVVYNEILKEAIQTRTRFEKIKNFHLTNKEIIDTLFFCKKQFPKDKNDVFFFFLMASSALMYYGYKMASVVAERDLDKTFFLVLNGSEIIFFYDYLFLNHAKVVQKKENVPEPFYKLYLLGKNWKDFIEDVAIKNFFMPESNLNVGILQSYNTYLSFREKLQKKIDALMDMIHEAYVEIGKYDIDLHKIFLKNTKSCKEEGVDTKENHVLCLPDCTLFFFEKMGDNLFDRILMSLREDESFLEIDFKFYLTKELLTGALAIIEILLYDGDGGRGEPKMEQEVFGFLLLESLQEDEDKFAEAIMSKNLKKIINAIKKEFNKKYLERKKTDVLDMFLSQKEILKRKKIKTLIEDLRSSLTYFIVNNKDLLPYENIEKYNSEEEIIEKASGEFDFVREIITTVLIEILFEEEKE